MGTGFLVQRGGSGGAGLNFKVVGGTTEPANPKENMIWVNTDHEITSYIFSATEPESPVEGMVWITTGISSAVEFNALKKNGLQVYPFSAKQYVGGAWVDKVAKSYQGGAWVDWWNGELYENGNQYDSITGGWKRDGYVHSLSSMAFSAGTHSNGKMVLSGALKLLGTQKAIDATKYNKLTISGKIVAAGSECLTVMVTTQKSPFNSNAVGSVSVNTKGEFSKDISLSGVNVPVYIVCYTQNSSTNNAEITSVKLS